MSPLPPAQGVTVRAVRRMLDRDGGVRRSIEQRLARRSARRILVITWTGLLVAAMVLPLAARLQDVFGPALLIGTIGMRFVVDPIVLALLAGVLGWIIRTAVGRVADLADDDIDERQIALRDRTHLVAYRLVGSTVLVMLLAGYVIADAVERWTVAPTFAAWLMADAFFLFVPLIAFLPSAVLAWYVPDEVDDGS